MEHWGGTGYTKGKQMTQDNNREEHFVYESNNEEEAEIAQLSALFENEAKVREQMGRWALLKQRPSLSECAECGESIPVARQEAVPGVQLCIDCAQLQESRS
jgi:phage/conjugal plasmid C-4 type zinc finger TraR family protein